MRSSSFPAVSLAFRFLLRRPQKDLQHTLFGSSMLASRVALRLVLYSLATSIPANALAVRTSLALASHYPSWPTDLITRASTCGGDASLSQCGNGLPADFCCPAQTTCTKISTTLTTSVICCPAGSDCSNISPINCNASLQNATLFPASQLHSTNTTGPFEQCGNACCPLGYGCENGMCVAQSAAAAVSSSSSAAPSSSLASTSTLTASSTTTTSTAAASPQSSEATAAGSSPTAEATSSGGFSSKSFAAGFVPGILIGALLCALILWCLLRRKKSPSEYTEKGTIRHQPAGFNNMLWNRPAMHERTISNPNSGPSGGHRTDFLRSTPPRWPPNDNAAESYNVSAEGPVTPERTPRIKSLFHRSFNFTPSPPTPIPTQSPLPHHLKRGTISHTISPLRALKKQKSMHSLRRQMTDASRGSRRTRPDLSRQGSGETIKVGLIDGPEPYTPNQRPARVAEETPILPSATYRPEAPNTGRSRQPSSSNWSHDASSSKYPSTAFVPRGPPPQTSPPAGGLGTPYTPSRYYGPSGGKITDVLVADDGLRVVRQNERPMTTFSNLMEKAGLRQDDLMMGTDTKRS